RLQDRTWFWFTPPQTNTLPSPSSTPVVPPSVSVEKRPLTGRGRQCELRVNHLFTRRRSRGRTQLLATSQSHDCQRHKARAHAARQTSLHGRLRLEHHPRLL